MTLNSDVKFERTLTLWFQKWHKDLAELSLEDSKSEILYVDGLFLSKHIMFQLGILRGIMCHDTER